jgi:hypothetical protein
MKRAEWLTSSNLLAVLVALPRQVSDRKRRLLACACCRLIWDKLSDKRSRGAVEVAEKMADGTATSVQIQKAVAGASAASERLQVAVRAYLGNTRRTKNDHPTLIAWSAACSALSCLNGNGKSAACAASVSVSNTLHYLKPVDDLPLALLRCIFGNPFRPLKISPTWLTWNNATIPRLAQEIYDARAFDRLPILADALEEAGCTNADILSHCRQPGPHARGCWVVDLILGKE